MRRLINLCYENSNCQNFSKDTLNSQIYCGNTQNKNYCNNKSYISNTHFSENCCKRDFIDNSNDRKALSPTIQVTAKLIYEAAESSQITPVPSLPSQLSSAKSTSTSPSNNDYFKHYTYTNNNTTVVTQLTNINVSPESSKNEFINSNLTVSDENNKYNFPDCHQNRITYKYHQNNQFHFTKFHVIDSHVYKSLYQRKSSQTHQYQQKQRSSKHQQLQQKYQQQPYHKNFYTYKNSITTNILSYTETDEVLQIGMHKVLVYVKNHRDAWPFMDPVEEDIAPRYYSIIRRYVI